MVTRNFLLTPRPIQQPCVTDIIFEFGDPVGFIKNIGISRIIQHQGSSFHGVLKNDPYKPGFYFSKTRPSKMQGKNGPQYQDEQAGTRQPLLI